MLLEDSEQALRTRQLTTPHFSVLPEFRETSYAERYRLLCEKLVQTRLYDAASLVMSPPEAGASCGEWRALDRATSPMTFFRSLAAHLLAAAEGSGAL